ncbi:Uncharacterized protein pbN1_33020 [Aromatoleum bremense]|uniref:Uncharacterized protein n=1 Tax=Aromatoleum bremense TaxID=76115 RepID=A0ABX1NXZ3_9RHOO|nr:hypothetical protein [Aromatoleum bremense]QTQ33288.1 Uncharacterized protein pbN1_33020 [Aromatoleum bremense]
MRASLEKASASATGGFWCFIASNVLWIAWGWHDDAYALIGLQIGLFATNLHGVRKNEPDA